MNNKIITGFFALMLAVGIPRAESNITEMINKALQDTSYMQSNSPLNGYMTTMKGILFLTALDTASKQNREILTVSGVDFRTATYQIKKIPRRYEAMVKFMASDTLNRLGGKYKTFRDAYFRSLLVYVREATLMEGDMKKYLYTELGIMGTPEYKEAVQDSTTYANRYISPEESAFVNGVMGVIKGMLNLPDPDSIPLGD